LQPKPFHCTDFCETIRVGGKENDDEHSRLPVGLGITAGRLQFKMFALWFTKTPFSSNILTVVQLLKIQRLLNVALMPSSPYLRTVSVTCVVAYCARGPKEQ
jgi:hypothetical protein